MVILFKPFPIRLPHGFSQFTNDFLRDPDSEIRLLHIFSAPEYGALIAPLQTYPIASALASVESDRATYRLAIETLGGL